MPNISQGILDDFLPIHPLEQSKKLPKRRPYKISDHDEHTFQQA